MEAAAEAAAAEIAAAPWVATAKMAGEGATEEPMAVAATRGGEVDVVVALDSTAAAAEVEEQAPCWADTAEAVVAAPAPSPVVWWEGRRCGWWARAAMKVEDR